MSALINKSQSKSQIAEKNTLITYQKDQNKHQATFSINWETIPDEETCSRCKYLLFLVADYINREDLQCSGKPVFENVAYDFIPLEGDDPETFDGSGFLLDSTDHEILLKDSAITLTTAPFTLPDLKNTNWSLHLIIEDSENLGDEVFSYKIRLHKNFLTSKVK